MDEQAELAAAADAEPEETSRKERHDAFTAERRKAFLAALKKNGCVLDACRAVGVSNRTAYNWYEADRDFAGQWDVAVRMASEDIEVAAYQRGVIGVEEPVWAYGKLVGTRIRRSDAILRLLLIGSNRKKYGSRVQPPRKRILAWEKKRIEKEVHARIAAEQKGAGERARQSILRKIEAIERHDEPNKLAAGWTRSDDGHWVPPGYVRTPGSGGESGMFSNPRENHELHGGGDGDDTL